MLMVTKFIGPDAKIRVDPDALTGHMDLKVYLEGDNDLEVSLTHEQNIRGESENGNPPTFQDMTYPGRWLGNMLIEHPFLKFSLCESPIEMAFFFNVMYQIKGIEPQVEVGPHRVDLAVPAKNVAIELDGHKFHKSRTQRTDDAQRRRYLQKEGWLVINFTGTEINKDVNACIEDAKEIIEKRPEVSE